MTDWQQVLDNDCAVPAGQPLDELASELVVRMRDPDPVIRDGASYTVLARWIDRGVLDQHLAWIGDQVTPWFDDPEVQARTFAPLVLDMVVTRGAWSPAWLDAFSRWYPAETDLRGCDSKLGWLHAVAHGADLLGTLGRRTEVDPTTMLGLAAERLRTPTDFAWRDLEDDRLGHAIGLVLTRTELTETQSTAWLDPVADLLSANVPSPVPARTSNALRTLRVVYLYATRGVRPTHSSPAIALRHHKRIQDHLATVLALQSPFTG